jgi:hypothetical protein
MPQPSLGFEELLVGESPPLRSCCQSLDAKINPKARVLNQGRTGNIERYSKPEFTVPEEQQWVTDRILGEQFGELVIGIVGAVDSFANRGQPDPVVWLEGIDSLIKTDGKVFHLARCF